ncbi:MAG: Mur ligase family protein [Candidatus Wildermuthbacteria bacterium]|nr:Mur ligase family protein [Candidatus Wildermuthbacteria bacterium]
MLLLTLYFIPLGLFWFCRTVKIVLFYIYLWQLKEYHIGRFLDHFRTEKGWRLFLNPLKIFKIALVAGPFIFPIFFPLVLGVSYLGELLLFCRDISRKTLKRPVLTLKTILLLTSSVSLAILAPVFLYFYFKQNLVRFAFGLLIIDVLTPVLVSLFVLLFQPITVLARNRIIGMARLKRESFKDLLVVGITGSYGKTSTKEFLYTILASKFGDKVLKTKEHQNSEIGISRCILNELSPEHEIFICEMGAYNKGGIKLLCDIVKPKIGILTGINEQHMATFGSQENIVKTKYELIEALPADGVAFFNAKNKYCVELYEKTLRRGSRQAFLYGGGVQLAGLENIEGAKAVAREIGLPAGRQGMSEEEINKACEKIDNKFGGIEIKNGINGLKIVDAIYSANPDSVIAHLEYLKTLPGQKVLVMPCLIELGKASKEVHRRIGAKIGEICDLAIITTKDRFEEIKAAFAEASASRRNAEVVFMENPREIFEKIKEFCKEGDIVFLESGVPVIKLLSNWLRD